MAADVLCTNCWLTQHFRPNKPVCLKCGSPLAVTGAPAGDASGFAAGQPINPQATMPAHGYGAAPMQPGPGGPPPGYAPPGTAGPPGAGIPQPGGPMPQPGGPMPYPGAQPMPYPGAQPMPYPGAPMAYPAGVPVSRPRGGFNWVAAVRIVMAIQLALVIVVLLLAGAAVGTVGVPVRTASGAVVTQQANVGAALVVVSAIAAAIGILFIWLAKFTAMRVIMLVLAILSMLNNFSSGNLSRGGPLGTVAVVSVVIGFAWMGLLVMSLISPPAPRRGY
jgi:hypothetical protein